MTAVEIEIAVVFFLVAGLLLFLGIRSFMERGFLFNNAYIYATKEENVKRWIKSRITDNRGLLFCILSAAFVVIGLSVLFRNGKIGLLVIPLAAAAIIYAVVSSILNNKR